MTSDPLTKTELRRLARDARARRDDRGLKRVLEQLVQMAPGSYEYVQLGGVLRRLGDHYEALLAYGRARDAAEHEGRENPAVYAGTAFVLLDLNYPDSKVREMLARAHALRPGDPEMLSVVAEGYRQLATRSGDASFVALAESLINRAERFGVQRLDERRRLDQIARTINGQIAAIDERMADLVRPRQARAGAGTMASAGRVSYLEA